MCLSARSVFCVDLNDFIFFLGELIMSYNYTTGLQYSIIFKNSVRFEGSLKVGEKLL
jgi:hypothetical protein